MEDAACRDARTPSGGMRDVFREKSPAPAAVSRPNRLLLLLFYFHGQRGFCLIG
jgi:hypothetical protein